MDEASDPSFASLLPHLNQSSSISAGVVWAGNGVVADTITALDEGVGPSRYNKENKPLAMYRGSFDGTMTPWAQASLQQHFNRSGVQLDLFTAPNASHSGLFPHPTVQYKNGNLLPVPSGGIAYAAVLNHSFDWITRVMGLAEPTTVTIV